MGAVVVVDLETTGWSPKIAFIIEFGAALVVGGEIRQTVGMLIRTPRKDDLYTRGAWAAKKVHGLEQSEVWATGMAPDKAEERVMTWMYNIREKYKVVVVTAYNLPFEQRFLNPWGVDTYGYSECLLKMAKRKLPTLGGHKLCDVAEHFGMDYRGGADHRAEVDAELAARVMIKLEEA